MSAKYLYYRWAIDLTNFTPTLQQLATSCVSIQPDEKNRLMKFHFLDDFLSSLIGRLLMRKFVNETTTIPYPDIKFDRDVRGKPYLKNPDPDSQQISFNVSHHGSMVILAGVVANGQSPSVSDFGVGVDVMKVEYTGGKPLSEFFRLMNRTFSEAEWRYINRAHHTEGDKLKAFIRHWCLKESYVKNVGVGITVDLRKISFAIHSDELGEDNIITDTTLRVNDFSAVGWSFEEHMLNADYCAAIAYKNCAPENVGIFRFFEFDELFPETSMPVTSDVEEYCRTALKKERKLPRS